jgi:hypothetical protein
MKFALARICMDNFLQTIMTAHNVIQELNKRVSAK